MINNESSSFKGPIVLEGPHCAILPEEPFKFLSSDIVIKDEGGDTITEIIDFVEGRTKPESIEGINYRRETGKIIHNRARKPITDLDRLPFPDRASFDLEDYLSPNIGRLFASRG